MEYDPSDSSGTDDDLPPSHQNRGVRGGRVVGNGRTAIVAPSYPRVQNDMETQIHRLEQEAYCSVLRAFKAQSDAISWEKESLITELRKELRVSDEEHRELLSRVNADDIIRRIREWRQAGGLQSGLLNNAQPIHDSIPSPTVSASRKRPKTSQSIPSLSVGAPSPAFHSQLHSASVQPSTSAAKRGASVGSKGKKSKSGMALPGVSTMKSMQFPATAPAGRGQVGAHAAMDPVEGAPYDPLIGRKVWTRWPDDNSFYEAVITDYNQNEGRHALVYDINTDNETWEWVDLKEISAQDIRWEGEDPGISRQAGDPGISRQAGDPGISRQAGRGGPGRGTKKPTGRVGTIPGAGRGRGSLKNQSKKVLPLPQNGIGKKNSNEIEILHTDTLIKEVERVFGASHPDPPEIEKAKKMLKEHEESLIDAIARLADASDGESEEGEHQLSHGLSMDRDRGWRNQKYVGNQHGANYEDDMVGAGGYDGDHMVADGVASGYHQGGDDDV